MPLLLKSHRQRSAGLNEHLLQTAVVRQFVPRAAAPYVAVMGTGRSDYPNQVNNVLGFPFIFRGALDVRATEINEEMKMAATRALAALAREDVPESVSRLYGLRSVKFGPDYLIPRAFDPRNIFKPGIVQNVRRLARPGDR